MPGEARRAVGAELHECPGDELFTDIGGAGSDVVFQAAERRDLREVDWDRCSDVVLVDLTVGRLGNRQEVEDSAAAVVHAEDRELGPGPARADQSAYVVQQRELTDHEVYGLARGD